MNDGIEGQRIILISGIIHMTMSITSFAILHLSVRPRRCLTILYLYMGVGTRMRGCGSVSLRGLEPCVVLKQLRSCIRYETTKKKTGPWLLYGIQNQNTTPEFKYHPPRREMG